MTPIDIGGASPLTKQDGKRGGTAAKASVTDAPSFTLDPELDAKGTPPGDTPRKLRDPLPHVATGDMKDIKDTTDAAPDAPSNFDSPPPEGEAFDTDSGIELVDEFWFEPKSAREIIEAEEVNAADIPAHGERPQGSVADTSSETEAAEEFESFIPRSAPEMPPKPRLEGSIEVETADAADDIAAMPGPHLQSDAAEPAPKKSFALPEQAPPRTFLANHEAHHKQVPPRAAVMANDSPLPSANGAIMMPAAKIGRPDQEVPSASFSQPLRADPHSQSDLTRLARMIQADRKPELPFDIRLPPEVASATAPASEPSISVSPLIRGAAGPALTVSASKVEHTIETTLDKALVDVTDTSVLDAGRSTEASTARDVKLIEIVRQPVMHGLQILARDGAPALRFNLDLSAGSLDLGRVQFSLTRDAGDVIVHVLAERPETLDIIRRSAAILETEFTGSGFDNISFHFGSDSAPHRHGSAPDVAVALNEGIEFEVLDATDPLGPDIGSAQSLNIFL